jgi:sporulation protein YlmC with PRC-barrel domain
MPRITIAAWVLLSSAAAATFAVAQTTPPMGTTTAVPGSITRNIGVWRASDLIGRDVFSPSGEDIGEISNLILRRDGQISAFVIEVGGFLGLGEHKVAVVPEAVQIDPIDTTATAGTVQGGLPASSPGAADIRAEMRVSSVLSPNRITLNIPTNQLRTAPPFRQP